MSDRNLSDLATPLPDLAHTELAPADIAPAGLAPAGLAPDAEAERLASLRAELDGIDDAVHDLLMRRAGIVRQVAARKAPGRGRLRPGREAAIIRRLLARNQAADSALPAAALLRVWRELLSGTVAMQGHFSIAVCETDAARGFTQASREHFGALTPVQIYSSPLHAIGAVSNGSAAIAVLPLPYEDEARNLAWWPALLHKDDPRIHVIARLPFWAPRAEGGSNVQALAVAPMPPDPSGDDISLIGLELAADVSRARLAQDMAEAGFACTNIHLRREDGFARALAEVAGFVTDDDPRLGRLRSAAHPPVVLGAYACPIQPA